MPTPTPTTPPPTGCVNQFADGPCGYPPSTGLEICGNCLRLVLDEPEPRRRRTLAANPHLAVGVVHRLAEDPDEQVRAQIAARDDLDNATTSLLADPAREPAPIVWRSMAATRGGAEHAWQLLGTDDPATLAILAGNPLVDPDALEQLARYPNPDVSWTASATLSGQPPSPIIADRIRQARRFDGAPFDEPPRLLPRPIASGGTAEHPPAITVPITTTTNVGAGSGANSLQRPPPPGLQGRGDYDSSDGGGRRRGPVLLIGAIALVAIAAVIVVIVFGGGDDKSQTTKVGPSPNSTITSATTTRTSAPSTTERAPTTTKAPATTVTTTPPTTPTTPAPTAPPTVPPATPPPVVTPPPSGPVTQAFTIRATTGRYCNSASVTVNFSPGPGDVVVTDETGAQVGAWSGASGQTHDLALPRPTATLTVRVTVTSSVGLSVSGSASGQSC